MVKLNKIYTRTGDGGQTSLGDGTRVAKGSLRVSAYGEVDEANACIGLAIVALKADKKTKEQAGILLGVQNDLFDMGADLCVPVRDDEEPDSVLRLTSTYVEAVERHIDALNADLKPLDSFILPGGSTAAAHLHLARTVVRRAERAITALAEEEAVNAEVIRYINRLSDLLFVMARQANNGGQDDVLWQPGGDR